jgi:hypothetical protein
MAVYEKPEMVTISGAVNYAENMFWLAKRSNTTFGEDLGAGFWWFEFG